MAAREQELKAKMAAGLDGDAGAHAALLRALVPVLRNFFRRRLAPPADPVEDLVQETLIAVHMRRAAYDRDRPFTAWLFAVARHKLADHYRRNRRHADAAALGEDPAAENFEAACSARIDVERLLGTLNARQSGAIRATRLEGRSLDEAAAAAGISTANAKISVYRGLRRLSEKVRNAPPAASGRRDRRDHAA